MAKDIFTPRGISDDVRDARGYVPYRKGHSEDITAVAPELAKHKDWLELFTQVDGWVMPKHPVMSPSLPSIRPQLRPDKAVEQDRWTHNHGDNWGKPMSERAQKQHLESPKWRDDHQNVGTKRTHTHIRTAKYALAPGGWAAIYESPPLAPPSSLKALVRALRDSKKPGSHRWEFTDAKRLDHNPITDFSRPGRVFFGIEGCLKNDSMASAGEKVFNVPAVGQWDAPELMLFALRYLRGWPVFIVPDADWAEKTEVIYHATACREFLRTTCLVDAHIAAPPIGQDAERDASGKLLYNGVDDYRATGGSMDDLRVLHRDVDEDGFADWADEYHGLRRRRGQKEKTRQLDLEVARAMTLTSAGGESIRSIEAITSCIFPLHESGALEEAYRRAFPWPVSPTLGKEFPEFSRHRGTDGWERRLRRVYRAMQRLEGHAFEGTGAYPEWQDGKWVPTWKKGRRSYRTPGGFKTPAEFVRLDGRLRVVEEDEPKTVGEVLGSREFALNENGVSIHAGLPSAK